MEKKFEHLIDDRNRELWEQMNREYRIELREGEEPGYLTQFGEEKICIQVDMQDRNPDPFTHELLHLYVKHRDLLIARDLKEWVENSGVITRIFSGSLKEHLGNCLEHEKMLPLFLEIGFDNKKFVRDYGERIMTDNELGELQASYRTSEMYKREAVDRYIGKYFSMKTANNPDLNYDNCYLGLERIDGDLYTALERFWQGWREFKLGESREKYQRMLDRLVLDLEAWEKDKVVL